MHHVLLGISEFFFPIESSVHASDHLVAAHKAEGSVSSIEKMHLDALQDIVEGRYRRAVNVYEQIVLKDPTDLLAIRTAHDLFILLGYVESIRMSSMQRR